MYAFVEKVPKLRILGVCDHRQAHHTCKNNFVLWAALAEECMAPSTREAFQSEARPFQ